MFCLEDNGSKVGFTFLNWHLAHWGFHFTDMWEPAPYKVALGGTSMPRADFLQRLAGAMKAPTRCGRWRVEADPITVAKWKPGAEEASTASMEDPSRAGLKRAEA